MDYIHHYCSPLGSITEASDGTNLTGLWFDGQKYYAASIAENHSVKNLPVFDMTDRWLNQYFSGEIPCFTPPIRLKGTDFQMLVWEILLTIPYGQTKTYSEISMLVAKSKGLSHMSAQAVGGAVSHNAVSLIVPCHRVIGANGSLTGYAGGLERKAWLLQMEKERLGARKTISMGLL